MKGVRGLGIAVPAQAVGDECPVAKPAISVDRIAGSGRECAARRLVVSEQHATARNQVQQIRGDRWGL